MTYTELTRGRIQIAGPDRLAFLQNLVTNDTGRLAGAPALYAAFLSPQGKFLHDFIMTDNGETLTLDCEGGARTEDLLRRLKMYKLRSKIELTAEPDVTVFAGWDEAPPPGAVADPRHPDMGWRTATRPAGAAVPFAAWDERRIRLNVPDGSRDMAVERDTALECNLDRLNGVSFDKGCYVGQEITARMHLRHIIKKHLRPVESKDEAALPAPGADLVIDGQMVGQMRSACGPVGLAMIRDDAAESLVKGLGAGPLRLLAA